MTDDDSADGNGADEDDAGSGGADADEQRAVRGVVYRREVSRVKIGVVVLLALFVVALGTTMGYWVTTDGGEIAVDSTTIETESGLDLGATVYEPPNASVDRPAPTVVLFHGYTGTRGTMETFAIEFANRGYVVVSVDQPGHGSSDPPPFEDGWGGPAALEYVHSLDGVDENRIALVGHSMGGFASLAAAKDRPNGYASVTLLGSTWGPMNGVEGIPEANETFPRNLAVVFSPYDELTPQMWNGSAPGTIGESEKLATAFDADPPIESEHWYGNFDTGAARMFTAPRVVHTGMHLSPTTIADTIAWVTATTGGPSDPRTENQRWQWALTGQVLAFVAGVVLVIGTTALVWLSLFGRNRRDHEVSGDNSRETDGGNGHEDDVNYDCVLTDTGFSRETMVVLTTLPALTMYPLYVFGTVLTPVTGLTPQELTHGFVFWALGTVVLAAGIVRMPSVDVRSLRATLRATRVRFRASTLLATPRPSTRPRPVLSSLVGRVRTWVDAQLPPRGRTHAAIAAAVIGVGSLYLLASLVSLVPGSGFRLWMVGFGTLPSQRWISALVYVVPFTVATVVLSYGLARAVASKPLLSAVRHSLALTCGGLVVFLALQYVPLFLGYGLPVPELGLLTLRALRATLLLAVATVVATVVTVLTDSPLPGGICAGPLVTWMVVATEPLHVALF